MASVVYPKFLQNSISGGAVNLSSATIKASLIDTADYTYSSAHDFLDDVAGAAIVATSGALASKTVTNGVFDAADVTWTAVTGDSCEAIIIYQDTGSAATSALIAYIDGISVTPNGTDITAQWNASGIFAL